MKTKIAVILMLASFVIFGIGVSIKQNYGTYIFGIGFIVMGTGILLCMEWAYAKWVSVVLGLGFALPGLAMIVLTYGYLELYWRDYRIVPIFISFIFYFILILDIWKVLMCSKKVMAQYAGCKSHFGRGPTTYEPCFSYQWGNQYFEGIQTGESFLKGQIKKYQVGGQYKIYLNPKNPRIIRAYRRLHLTDILFFIIGTATVYITVYMVFRFW